MTEKELTEIEKDVGAYEAIEGKLDIIEAILGVKNET